MWLLVIEEIGHYGDGTVYVECGEYAFVAHGDEIVEYTYDPAAK